MLLPALILISTQAQSADPLATLQPPPGQACVLTLHAKGVQIYRAQPKKGAAGQFEWVFQAPEAELSDDGGHVAAHHGAGPTWEAPDGSKALGAVKGKADAPGADAIPWLLLAATPTGAGLFSKVTYIQRVNTHGGKAPAACTASDEGKVLRVSYTADYRFFTPEHE